jgi:hypothetical protein
LGHKLPASLASFLAWVERIDVRLWEKFLEKGDGELKALWDAARPWVEGHGEELEWKM